MVALATLAGCSSAPAPPPASVEGTSIAASGRPCEPPGPLPSSPALPAGLDLPPGSIVTAGAAEGGQTVLTGRVGSSVEDVLDHFRTAIDRAAFVLQRDEDEGRSGVLEFFSASGEGSVVIARQTCPRGEVGFTVRVRQPG